MDGTLINYRTHEVPVDGGTLHVGAWQAGGPVRRVVLAIHGITSSHRAWQLVGERLTAGTLLLGIDLRGRGRSGDLPGPYGLAHHVDDCVAVLDALADGRCDTVAGHSMGGFVSVLLAARHPDRVGSLLLVDGGVPLLLPEGVSLDEARTVGLGPAAERLTRTFASRDEYVDFWRAHPAFADEFTAAVRDYVEYDLAPDGPPWRSSCSLEAMSTDYAGQFVGGPVDRAWADVRSPVVFLRAPAGLMAEPGGLYPAERLRSWAAPYRRSRWHEVPDVNHYTITLGARGAEAVVAHLQPKAQVTKAG